MHKGAKHEGIMDYALDADSAVALENASKRFRDEMNAVNLLEKTELAASSGNIKDLEAAISTTEASGVSKELFNEKIRSVADKALVYILLENDIRRVDVDSIMNSINDYKNMNEYLDEKMLDSDNNLTAKIATSLMSFENLALRFSLINAKNAELTQTIARTFLDRLAGLKDALTFLDVEAKYDYIRSI